MNNAYLLDGALLRQHGLTLDTLALADTAYLYSDLGQDAASVGPILLPETPAALAFANSLINAEDSRRFATSLLTYRGPLESLRDHLSQLRYLETTHDNPRHYFLRYADMRVFEVLAGVVTAEQCRGLLGPIVRWSFVAPDKTFLELSPPGPPNGAISALPLRVSPSQLDSFLRNSRYHELLHATLAHRPGLAQRGNLGQQHAWTQQAHDWLLEQHIQHGGLQVVVNEAVWRTHGAALSSSEFIALVQQGTDDRQLERARVWSAKHAVA
ncbi:DUF4123 domain-containing protein [Dyella terrae]|uniref:DUF4123 domain-containing protein n=1 Tax=Dyella terrae TaxID=522259 RepID=UPI001EFE307B|nr:DUF4123 domain-containing protein [Dyella terrae]ULU23934.1 DUF4123 protein [Dyella terrae]